APRIQRQYEPRRSDIETSLALYSAAGDLRGVVACLNELSFAETWAGNYARAAAFSDEAIRLARRAADETSIATALARAAWSSVGYEDIQRRAHEAIGYLRRVDNIEQLGQVCSLAGYAALVEKRYREAVEWIDQELAAAVTLDDRRSYSIAQGN